MSLLDHHRNMPCDPCGQVTLHVGQWPTKRSGRFRFKIYTCSKCGHAEWRLLDDNPEAVR